MVVAGPVEPFHDAFSPNFRRVENQGARVEFINDLARNGDHIFSRLDGPSCKKIITTNVPKKSTPLREVLSEYFCKLYNRPITKSETEFIVEGLEIIKIKIGESLLAGAVV